MLLDRLLFRNLFNIVQNSVENNLLDSFEDMLIDKLRGHGVVFYTSSTSATVERFYPYNDEQSIFPLPRYTRISNINKIEKFPRKDTSDTTDITDEVTFQKLGIDSDVAYRLHTFNSIRHDEGLAVEAIWGFDKDTNFPKGLQNQLIPLFDKYLGAIRNRQQSNIKSKKIGEVTIDYEPTSTPESLDTIETNLNRTLANYFI